MFRSTLFSGELRTAYDRLRSIIKEYRSMVVAYSGGVDSGLLSFVAREVLKDRMLSVLGVSPSLPARERGTAIAFLETHGIPYQCIETGEMENERYRANEADRCYHCKLELFSRLQEIAKAHGFSCIAYGANADDSGDFRPGSEAAREKSVAAPLLEAGLGKEEVRGLARTLSLELWNKPANACLASRIPYRSRISASKLKQVERAEDALRDLGFSVCRVRHHGDLARIEVPLEDRPRFMENEVWKTAVKEIKKAGFTFVALDIEGFRSGSMNRALMKESKSNPVSGSPGSRGRGPSREG